MKNQKLTLVLIVMISAIALSFASQNKPAYYLDLQSEFISASQDKVTASTLIALMKKGEDKWNKYRKTHPGDNFGELLKEADLSGMDFSNFNLTMINLKEANLSGANFTNANMAGVNMKEANVEGAIFKNDNLANANMKELTLKGCNLNRANLSEANLKEVTATDCNFSETNLKGTILSEATIKNCNFKRAIANSITSFPSGFNVSIAGIKVID